MKFQIYFYDSEPHYGGWFYCETIDAESDDEAFKQAKMCYGEHVKIKKVTEVDKYGRNY